MKIRILDDQGRRLLYRRSPSFYQGSAISFSFCIASTWMCMILFHITFRGTFVDSKYRLSKDCTSISLAGRRITAIMGQAFDFTLKPYNTDCDNGGCKTYRGSQIVCEKNPGCASCTTYTGLFASNMIQVEIWLYSDINVIAPGATCTIRRTQMAGLYPVACVIQNNHASDTYQYLLRVVVLNLGNPYDLGQQSDIDAMVKLGALVKAVAGPIDPESSNVYWPETNRVYRPGDKLVLTVTLKDKYGNIVSAKTGRADLDYPWNVTVVNTRTNVPSYPSFDVAIDRDGYHNITFEADEVGPHTVSVSSNGKIVGRHSLSFNVETGLVYLPLCRGSWLDNKDTFVAGTRAQFRLRLVDKSNAPLGFNSWLILWFFKMFDQAGSRETPKDISMKNEDDAAYVRIGFTTAKAGRHYVFIGNSTFFVPGSPFPFDVIVGPVSIPACKGVLMEDVDFKAGSPVILNITLFDCCGNLVTRLTYVEFSVSISFYGSKLSSPSIVKGLEQSAGYQTISFYPTMSGQYSMSVGVKRESISNSPFSFTVIPGT